MKFDCPYIGSFHSGSRQSSTEDLGFIGYFQIEV